MNERHLVWVTDTAGAEEAMWAIQPTARGTGGALLHATLRIAAESGDRAVVAVLPADHWTADPLRYMEPITRAAVQVENCSDDVVLIGGEPWWPETGYRWLRLRAPHRAEPVAARLVGGTCGGDWWWTGALVYSVGTMLRLFAALAPRWWRALGGGASPPTRSQVRHAYERLPALSLAADLLSRASTHIKALPIRRVPWVDLDQPHHVRRSMGMIRPAGDIVSMPIQGL